MNDRPRKHPNAKCEDCTLYHRPYVADKPGRTNEVMFVIEAPGQEDTRTGELLSGSSGKLLRSIFKTYKIEQRDAYVTSLVGCLPIQGKPSKTEINCCASRLHSTISDIKPETVVAFGAEPSKAVMLSKEGVTSLRIGPPKRYPLNDEVRVVPTVSPAYVLRSADNFPSLVKDIGKIFESSVSVSWNAPDWIVIDDDSEHSLEILRRVARNYGRLTVDIEVGVEKDEFGTHPERYDFLCIGIAYTANDVLVIGENALKSSRIKHELRYLFENNRLDCHHGKFDIAAIQRYAPGAQLGFDTMYAHYATDERTGIHALETVSREILQSPSWKSEIKPHVKDGNYSSVPRDILYRYNAYDCANTYRLVDYFEPRLAKENLRGLHDFLVRTTNGLIPLELEGLLVDTEYLDVLDNELQAEGEWLETFLAAKFVLMNPRSWQQVQRVLKGFGVHAKSTDEATLTDVYATRLRLTGQQAVARLEMSAKTTPYKDPACEFIHYLLEYRGLAKLWGTYVDGTRRRLFNGRIYPNISLHTTVTGRTSSKDPNLQNQPRGKVIKRLFIPAPGHSYVQCDYRAAELRTIGILARCGYLRSVLNDPSRDIHGEVATQYYGAGFSSEQRTRCKQVVFGSNYGAEAARVADILGVSIIEGGKFLKTWFSMIPEVEEWRDEIKRMIYAGEDLVTFTGRHRRYRLISDLNKKSLIKEGWAMVPQSSASDIGLEAMNRLRLDYKMPTRMFVHDSILAEVPTEHTDEALKLMGGVMQNTAAEVFDDYITFFTEGKKGQSWAEV